jgi:DNA adenine methylase
MSQNLRFKSNKTKPSNMSSLKSPLRYPGGKTRACKLLEKIVAERFDVSKIQTLISPFFGGGSFEFHICTQFGINVIGNDAFSPLFHFWHHCAHNNSELCEKIMELYGNVDKELFSNMRQDIMNQEDSLQQAAHYFVINRCSFSGATLSGGFSKESSKKRFTLSSIERIKKLALTDLVNRVSFANTDFEEFIESNYKNDGTTLMFLDPPYYLEKGSKLYGNNGDMHVGFDHRRLRDVLRDKRNWIMTYNSCEYIKELYADCVIIETSWSYGMNSTKESSEIIIIKTDS